MIKHLLFDVDHKNIYIWKDVNLPEPSWIAINPINGHSHYCYTLKSAVCISKKGREKPKKFVDDVKLKMAAGLNADPNYVGLTTKNILHEYWYVLIGSKHDYELAELAEYAYKFKKQYKPKKEEVIGSRNCDLFEFGRHWAYINVARYSSQWVFQEAVLNQLMVNNTYRSPLHYNEVRATAKSIANWTWTNYERHNAKLSERQSKRGILSGKARRSNSKHTRDMALILHLWLRETQAETAERLCISKRTVAYWMADHRKKNF
jgi:hypothetical protein